MIEYFYEQNGSSEGMYKEPLQKLPDFEEVKR